MTTPVVHDKTPRVALASGCLLGEGALWDHRTGTLLFVDIKNPAIWRHHPASGRHDRVEAPERVGFVALTPDPDVVVAGFKSGLKRFHLGSRETQDIAAPAPARAENRINDGSVGPDGCLYFGTMDDGESEPTGAFWCWDGQALTQFDKGIVVTNGPAVSPDGRLLYTTDSKKAVVRAHDITADGPGAPRLFVRFEEGWGHPDGMAVDAEGHVWICHWGASRISRFSPEGRVERIVPVPTAQVTKCAFGGPGLTTLYITTAGIDRDPAIDPMAGHVFVVETGIRGLEAQVFER
jgi:sugar lactone lactonase YvrE